MQIAETNSLVVSILEFASGSTYYRGTKDIPVDKLDHVKVKTDGVWGPATYLSSDLKTAKWYASKGCDYFGVVTIYTVTSSLKALEIKPGQDYEQPHPTEEVLNLLPSGQKKFKTKEKSIPINSVARRALDLGYDAVDVQDVGHRLSEPMLCLLKPGHLKPSGYLIYDIETDKFVPVSLRNASSYMAKLLDAKKRFES